MKKLTLLILLFIPLGLFANTRQFIEAAKRGALPQIQRMIQNGMKPNIQDSSGRTAVMEASRFGHLKIVSFLVNLNADINLADKYGFTALMFAVHNGHVQITELLIKKGAKIKAQDSKGRDALHYERVAVKNSKKLLKLLKSDGVQ